MDAAPPGHGQVLGKQFGLSPSKVSNLRIEFDMGCDKTGFRFCLRDALVAIADSSPYHD